MGKVKRKSPYAGEWKPFFRKLPWLLLIPAFYGIGILAAKYPDTTENVYSAPLYPYISRALGYITSLARGVSVSECVVLGLIVAAIVLVIVFIVKLFSGRLRFAQLMSFIMGVCVFALEKDSAAEFSKIPAAYRLLGADYSIFSGTVYPAKGVKASVAMSYGGIAGIYIPYFAEANVNINQPALLIASSAAHETAHYLGVAREDEANFVSYLACTYSLDASVRYSGTMLALINCANQLYASDAELYRRLVSEYYSEGMLRDLRDYNAYWDSFEGPIEEAVDNMNDNYLKFNKQENGVKSYGMMVDLLLAYYAKGSAQ